MAVSCLVGFHFDPTTKLVVPVSLYHLSREQLLSPRPIVMMLLGQALTSGAQADMYDSWNLPVCKDFPMTVTDPPPGACYGVEHTDYQAFNRQFNLNNTASIFYGRFSYRSSSHFCGPWHWPTDHSTRSYRSAEHDSSGSSTISTCSLETAKYRKYQLLGNLSQQCAQSVNARLACLPYRRGCNRDPLSTRVSTLLVPCAQRTAVKSSLLWILVCLVIRGLLLFIVA